MINHIDDKQLNNVVFTKEQRTFECPNMKCEGGTFNFDKLVSLLNIDEYLSMIAVVSEKISKNKEFTALLHYKKFGDEKNLLQDVPEAERLSRQWCDRFTILTPCCNRAFILRDGCMSISCECGKNFCGLCLNFVAVDIDSNGPCHNHVKFCPWNNFFRGLFFTPEWYMTFNHSSRIATELQIFINKLIKENKFDLLFEFCNLLQPELKQYRVKLCENGVVYLVLTAEQKPYVEKIYGGVKPDEPEPDGRLRVSPIKRRAKRKCSLCKGNVVNINVKTIFQLLIICV
jgi:hypothetical protein